MIFSKTTAATFAVAVGMMLGQQTQKHTVHFKYPAGMDLLGGPSEKDVNCDLIYQPKTWGPGTLWATCAFLKNADNNEQIVCHDTDVMPATEAAQRSALSSALLAGFRHAAIAHKQCQRIAGQAEMRAGKTAADVATTFGANWEQGTSCPLVEIINACKAKLRSPTPELVK